MSYRYLTYTLTSRAPLLLRQPGGDPNSATTYPYVPGASVRGVVARAVRNDNTLLQQLVLSGNVRYLNAYPVLGGRRAFAAPVSLRARKNAPRDDSRHWDLAAYSLGHGGESEPEEDLPKGDPLGPARWRFVTIGGDTLVGGDVRVSGRLHHARDRERGRPWNADDSIERHGEVFAYESVDAEQQFAGVLQLRASDDESLDRLENDAHDALGLIVHLGRSRNAGYGGDVQLAWNDSQPREVTGKSLDGDVSPGTRFRLLLTAPYIGRNSSGQVDPTALLDEVAQRLSVTVNAVHWSFTTAGGYNRTWAMPLPQQAALAAGSVLVLRANEHVSRDTLLQFEHEGLGLRRIDGFGRCLLLPEPVRLLHVTNASRPGPTPQPPAGTPLTELISRRIAEDEVRRRIRTLAAHVAQNASRPPRASVLGRLRVPLRSPADGLPQLRRWLAAASATAAPGGDGRDGRLAAPARRQLERCRLTVTPRKSVRLGAWLAGVVDAPGHDRLEISELLGLDSVTRAAYPTDRAIVRDWLSRGMDQEFRAALADAILAALSVRVRSSVDESAEEQSS